MDKRGGAVEMERPQFHAEKSGVYVDISIDGNKPEADGYVRRSPVQQLHVDPHYKRRLLRNVISGIVVAVIVVVAIATLLRYVSFR